MEKSNLVSLAEKTCRKCGCVYSGRRCKPCWSRYIKEWNAANPDKVKATSLAYAEKHREEARNRAAKWYKENPDKAKKYRTEWKLANPEKVLEAKKKHYVANKDAIIARAREWSKRNPEVGRLHVINRRARQRANGGVLSKGLAGKLIALQRGKCACCGADLKKSKYHMDHITPVSRGGANVDANIQLLCPSCNHAKGAKHSVDFMQARGLLL